MAANEGRFEEAERFFSIYLREEPASASGWSNLGNVHLSQARPQMLCAACRQLPSLWQQSFWHCAKAAAPAWVACVQGKAAQAESDYSRAIELAPEVRWASAVLHAALRCAACCPATL